LSWSWWLTIYTTCFVFMGFLRFYICQCQFAWLKLFKPLIPTFDHIGNMFDTCVEVPGMDSSLYGWWLIDDYNYQFQLHASELQCAIQMEVEFWSLGLAIQFGEQNFPTTTLEKKLLKNSPVLTRFENLYV
jgi:hypothetical protein